jgi:hypothetical protein
MKATSAQGLTGFILDTFNGVRVFRVYKKDSMAYTDYELRHGDLEVKIVDADAVLYELDNGTNLLDYSPETLGLTNDSSTCT